MYTFCSSYSKEYLYQYFNTSRQGYFQYTHRQSQSKLEEEIILKLVQEQKRLLPNSGGRKMYFLIKEDLLKMNIKCGRDKLFELLRKYDLLVRPKKNKSKTTNSKHHYRIHKNLIKDLIISRIHQVWVTDITYLRTFNGFVYLALVTDAFSRKIIGWELSSTLELEGCLTALKKALKSISKKFLRYYPLIHHSDRGSQYCSNIYTQLLVNHNIMISMAAQGNCYENAIAERVNGILKMEFGLEQLFINEKWAFNSTKDAIHKYNTMRPHLALNYATPSSYFDKNLKELKSKMN